MSNRPQTPEPHLDPHHDLADAPADDAARDGASPVGVQDRRGSRPIDRIVEPEAAASTVQREPGKVGLAVLVAVVLILIGVGIGAFVMQRPVPTLGLAAIAIGMLLLFAAPTLTATAVEPEPARRSGSDTRDPAPGPRSGPPTPPRDGGEKKATAHPNQS